MKLEVSGVKEGQPVPEKFAFGVFNEQDHMSFGPNRNPELFWSDAPDGTKSFAVIMFDPDVPSVADDVNQEGKTVSKEIPRVDFFHWLLVDIPANISRIPEGEDSDGVIPKGKDHGPVNVGVRGINNYTQFLAGNPDMAGTYAGYDGPAHPGMMKFCITTILRCTHWMSTAWVWTVSLMATMCARLWPGMCWPAPE